MVPEGWKNVILGDLCVLMTNGFVGTSTTHYTTSGVPYLMANNVRTNFLDVRNLTFVTQAFHDANKRTHLRQGDILTVQTGFIGTSCLVPIEYEGGNAHALIISRVNPKLANPQYICQFLNSPVGVKEIQRIQTIGGRPHLNTGDFMSLPVSLPPLPEQRSIAAVLATWDRTIEQTTRLIEAKRRLKQGLMQQLLTGRQRFISFNDRWTRLTIGDLLRESRIVSTSPNVEKRITVKLNLKGVEQREVKGTEEGTVYYIRRVGQFIYGKQNLHKGAMGIIPIELDGFESSQDIPAFDFLGRCIPDWFYFYMSRDHFYKSLESVAKGTGSKRIHPVDLFAIHIDVPSIEEQRRIAQVLNTSDREIALLEQYLDALKAQKQALMQQLLTGKKRVPVTQEA